MNPAFSVVFLTTLSGAAQGLVVLVALGTLLGLSNDAFASDALVLAALLLVAALAASFAHLGRPMRAWRAAFMWRTSWLSREVIVLPMFIGVIAVWWWGLRAGLPAPWTGIAAPLVALVVAAMLWYCTAMIYACLRFVEEWAQPLTLVNFVLTGLSSGFVLGCALLSIAPERRLLGAAGPGALAFTVAAGICRAVAVSRNARLRHRSTLSSATGIPGADVRQTSMGMSAGSFNTREFFHRATAAGLRRIRVALFGLGFVLPAIVGIVAIVVDRPSIWWLAVASQAVGLVADRWFFFAQAKHPQNLYYQVVS